MVQCVNNIVHFIHTLRWSFRAGVNWAIQLGFYSSQFLNQSRAINAFPHLKNFRLKKKIVAAGEIHIVTCAPLSVLQCRKVLLVNYRSVIFCKDWFSPISPPTCHLNPFSRLTSYNHPSSLPLSWFVLLNARKKKLAQYLVLSHWLIPRGAEFTYPHIHTSLSQEKRVEKQT